MNLTYILIGIIAAMVITFNIVKAVILIHLIVKIMNENKSSKQRGA